MRRRRKCIAAAVLVTADAEPGMHMVWPNPFLIGQYGGTDERSRGLLSRSPEKVCETQVVAVGQQVDPRADHDQRVKNGADRMTAKFLDGVGSTVTRMYVCFFLIGRFRCACASCALW